MFGTQTLCCVSIDQRISQTAKSISDLPPSAVIDSKNETSVHVLLPNERRSSAIEYPSV